MLDILDGVIATAAVVLALSLIVQAIQQITKQVLSLKSAYMRRELLAMFGSADEATLSTSLARAVRVRVVNRPAWISKSVDTVLGAIPRWTWSMIDMVPSSMQPLPLRSMRAGETAYAIVDQLSEKLKSFGYRDLELLENVDKEGLTKMVAGLPMFEGIDLEKEKPDDLVKAAQEASARLQSVQAAAGGNPSEKRRRQLRDARATEQVARLRAQAARMLERALRDADTWFDTTMKAFQEHYERRMKMWATMLSALVVIAVNADIVTIYTEFSTSKPRRDAVLAAVPALMETAQRELAADTARATSAKPDSVVRYHVAVIESLATAKSFELIRWNTVTGDSLRYRPPLDEGLPLAASDFWKALRKNILGWVAMTLLVSLGAPFWYDLLKTLVGVKEKLRGRRAEIGGK